MKAAAAGSGLDVLVGAARRPRAAAAGTAALERTPHARGDRRDSVSISAEARALLAAEQRAASTSKPAVTRPGATVAASPPAEPRTLGAEELTPEEQKEVAELERRDRAVRQHEKAHTSALGGGQPSFSYETGPDGRRYAVEGEVPIDISEVPGDPQATIARAQRIARAALAPADPSQADRAAAREARRIEREARAELRDGGEGPVDAAHDHDHTGADCHVCAARATG